MAAHGRSDARGTARLLANMALASINNPRRGEPQEVALNNMYRLLQSFRKDAFFGHEAPADAPVEASEKLTLRPPIERNVRDVIFLNGAGIEDGQVDPGSGARQLIAGFIDQNRVVREAPVDFVRHGRTDHPRCAGG